MYEQLLKLDNILINFSASGMHAINIVLAFVMFGVALGIRPRMIKEVFSKPKSVVIGILSQFVLLPALTFLLIVIFNRYITPMVAMGMILVAACPGGNISNFMSQLGKANVELSVTLSAITTALCPILTPANFALWGGLYVNFVNSNAGGALRELQIDIFEMFKSMLLLLVIPMALGMLSAHYLPKLTEKLRKPLQWLSIIFFALMVILAFSNNFNLFINYIGYIAILVFIHNGLALAGGYTFATMTHLSRKDRRTLTIETGIQNSGLGLVLLFNPKIFPPDLAIGGMLFVTAWWGIWHIVSGMTVASIFAWRDKKLTTNAPST